MRTDLSDPFRSGKRSLIPSVKIVPKVRKNSSGLMGVNCKDRSRRTMRFLIMSGSCSSSCCRRRRMLEGAVSLLLLLPLPILLGVPLLIVVALAPKLMGTALSYHSLSSGCKENKGSMSGQLSQLTMADQSMAIKDPGA